MTIPQALLAFVAASVLLTLTPGFDTALVVQTALAQARVHRTLDAATGTVFLAFGAKLLLDRAR
jgi:threonine/homoserine/homoserine lactone efflux protein